MALVVAFGVFIAAMVTCLVIGKSIALALAVGFIAFVSVGVAKGFTIGSTIGMAWQSIRETVVVVEIWLMIGLLTGTWRASGTISYFVYYGVSLVKPHVFILLTFILCCVLSYILGTSFAVSGTLGVMLMALANSAGVNPALTAGAIMSGIYFGDRCSPVSSSAILVANVTGTDLRANVRRMFETGLIPLILSVIIYGVFSYMNPMSSVDESIMNPLQQDFNLTPWTLLPIAFIVILPLKFDIRWAFIGGIVSAGVVAYVFQDLSMAECIKSAIVGYTPSSASLADVLSGGGMLEMVESCIIVMLACSYSGIFAGTDMLSDIQEILDKLVGKTSKFIATLILSLITSCIFCSQTIAAMLCNDLMKKIYEKAGGNNYELAMDIENSAITDCVLFPWCIAASVPLTMLGASNEALLYAFLVWLIPLCYIFTKKHWYSK